MSNVVDVFAFLMNLKQPIESGAMEGGACIVPVEVATVSQSMPVLATNVIVILAVVELLRARKVQIINQAVYQVLV